MAEPINGCPDQMPSGFLSEGVDGGSRERTGMGKQSSRVVQCPLSKAKELPNGNQLNCVRFTYVGTQR